MDTPCLSGVWLHTLVCSNYVYYNNLPFIQKMCDLRYVLICTIIFSKPCPDFHLESKTLIVFLLFCFFCSEEDKIIFGQVFVSLSQDSFERHIFNLPATCWDRTARLIKLREYMVHWMQKRYLKMMMRGKESYTQKTLPHQLPNLPSSTHCSRKVRAPWTTC